MLRTVTLSLALFRAVPLAGDLLAQHALWHATLSVGEAAEWEDFLDGLKPGPDLAPRLDQARAAWRASGSPLEEGAEQLLAAARAAEEDV